MLKPAPLPNTKHYHERKRQSLGTIGTIGSTFAQSHPVLTEYQSPYRSNVDRDGIGTKVQPPASITLPVRVVVTFTGKHVEWARPNPRSGDLGQRADLPPFEYYGYSVSVFALPEGHERDNNGNMITLPEPIIFHSTYREGTGHAPGWADPADVLSDLLSDAAMAEGYANWQSYAADYVDGDGSSTDELMRARRAYKQSAKIARKLRAMLGDQYELACEIAGNR